MNNTDIIKDKLNILDVVGSYVSLEKAGKTYKGKSPFTNEKTPSFFVSPEKGFFYCFSSGKGGDMFSFVQEIERVDFREALKILADKAGVSLNKDSLKKNAHENIQYKILDDITKWYEIHLRKNNEVVQYLLSRGLTKETLIKFRIGFALDAWTDAYDFLSKRNYRTADMQAVGLVVNKEGTSRYYDRFRSRVMFPLFDSRGRVIGFSGRIFSEKEDLKAAKYVNSSDGPLFDKSKVLYGYHTAKSAMSKSGYCILVEGQFDVLMAQQSGYENTVAVSGTGLTFNEKYTYKVIKSVKLPNGSLVSPGNLVELTPLQAQDIQDSLVLQEHKESEDYQINLIKRFTDTVVLAFDSDKAGIKATRRSALAAYRNGMNVRVVVMPEGMDPADMISHSKEQWDVAVTDARDYIDYRLDHLRKQDYDFENKKKIVREDLFTFIYLIKSAMTQDKALQKIALFLGVGIDAVRSDFKNFQPEEELSIVSLDTKKISTKQNFDIQKNIISMYAYALDKEFNKDEILLQKIQELYLYLFGSDIHGDLENIDEVEKNVQLFIIQERHGENPESFFWHAVYTDLVEEKIRRVSVESTDLLKAIRTAEGSGDTALVIELQKKHQQLLTTKNDLTNSIRK